MKIKKLNEFEYSITGDANGTYMVDLMANSRKGSCTCKHFAMRINPKWRRGDYADPCKHILVAFGFAVWHRVN